MKTMFKFLSFAAILAVAAVPAARADDLGGPGVYWGKGNVDGNFTIATDSTVQLGLKAITRGVAPPIPQLGDTYKYKPGVQWDFVFSAYTGASTLDAYTYSITITDTTNPSSATFAPDSTFITDDALVNSSGDICNAFGQPNCTTPYDPANYDGFQGGEYPGFGFALGTGFNPNSYDHYTIVFTATPTGAGSVVTDTINVVPTPEPSSLVFLGTGLLGGLGTMIRRRRIA
jgi:PEP-CTERM motif